MKLFCSLDVIKEGIATFTTRFTVFVLATFTFIVAESQNKVYAYYMDTNMQTVPKENASILGKGRRIDSTFVMQYYTLKDNQLFLIEHYKDSTLKVLHGRVLAFHPNRRQSETSVFKNNMLHGEWIKCDTSGRVTDSSAYYESMPAYVVKYMYLANGDRKKVYEFDNTPAKKWPDEKSIVMASDGAVIGTEIWKNLVYSGKYAFIQDKLSMDKFMVFKLSDEIFDRAVASDPKPKESDFFKTGQTFEINEFDMDGNKLRSKELKGKVLVINCWFINCKPCRMEMPDLNSLVKDFKDSANVKFIGIALDGKSAIKQFLKLSPFNYQIVADGRFAAEKYGVTSYPTHVIVDGEGKVYFHTISSPRQLFYWMRKTIKELLEKQRNLEN